MPSPRHHHSRKRQYISCAIFVVCLCVLLFVGSLLFIDRLFTEKTKSHIFDKVSQVPPHEVGLVLGTSKYIGKVLNTYYSHRIEAAIRLHYTGKVTHFLLSGDNAHKSYNEPWTMKRDLLKAGIEERNIHLDYAGFRTLDSIVRAKKVFKANNFLIITQKFHCERALYIAQFYNINASCLAVPGANDNSGIYLRIREMFARVKAILDLYVLDQKPKFLGPEEPIIADESQHNLSEQDDDQIHTHDPK
ncbi:MAG: SanA/YdcF family protein [Vibrio sp.]